MTARVGLSQGIERKRRVGAITGNFPGYFNVSNLAADLENHWPIGNRQRKMETVECLRCRAQFSPFTTFCGVRWGRRKLFVRPLNPMRRVALLVESVR